MRVNSLILRALRGCAFIAAMLLFALPSKAVILWSDLGAILVHENGPGTDILAGALKRDDSAFDTLYFKFHVDPISDASTEEYFAFFELYEGDVERLGVGNALKAWAYSAFVSADHAGKATTSDSYIDLRSATQDPTTPGANSAFEHPRRGVGRTIVFKVQYVPGGDDLVTVWLNPDLGPGANEVYQPESLTTRFSANAAFDSIRLRHGGGGGGWTFSDIAIATSFSDFVDTSSAKAGASSREVAPKTLPFSFSSWRRQQGMPYDSVQALCQSGDGYLWIGGDDGLARFDGVRFVQFGTRSDLHGAPVKNLAADKQGRIWIGTGGGGLLRLDGGRFATFRRQEGLPDDSITALAQDKEDRLWVGTEQGLAVYQNGKFMQPFAEQPFHTKPITALFCDRDGTLWVAAGGSGVFRNRAGNFTELKDGEVERLLRDTHCLMVDHSGRIWVGAGDDYVLCRDNDQWQRYRIPRHSGRPFVKMLVEEPDGAVWAGSINEGLFRFNGGKLKPVDAGSGLSDNRIRSLLVDREGKLWVGTEYGLNRLRHNIVFSFGQDQGLGYGPVLGLGEVAPGVIWAARPKDGLYRSEGRNFTRLTAAGLPARDPQVTALLVTRDGSCLVAHAGGLLRYRDPQAVSDEYTDLGLTNLDVISLAEDSEGSIWAGARQGIVMRLARGRWEEWKELRETHPITAIVPVANGPVWIGTDGGGLYRVAEIGGAHYDRNSGLGSDSIRTLYLDAGQMLWIGTAEGGISWWRNGSTGTLTHREGLPDNSVSQILEDDAGNLWLGGNRGITCVTILDLLQAATGKSRPLPARLFGGVEGMNSEECTSGFFPAGLKTRSGLLWFSTSMGVVAAQPALRTNSLSAPRVLIEEVFVDGAPAIASDRLRIPPGRHRLDVQYTALGMDAPETTQFRYRLAPLDADWVEAGVRRTAFYNYVPPGDYQFQLSACDRDGAWNENSASMVVTVSRHFWQSWWFLGPAGLGLLVSIAGGGRFVEKRAVQRRLRNLEQEHRLERERTRIAQDLHDQMGAKLCRISFLSEHARRNDGLPGELQHEINSISETSREVLHSLDEIVWAVDPHNDTLEHAASYIGQYSQEYFQMTGIECELSVPASLPTLRISSHMRHHLFLAVHEALTNVLKHSGAAVAKIAIRCDNSQLEISVSDNGTGFDPATSNSDSSSGHNGLRNMTQRLADIGGSCRLESDQGRGTTVRFLVPVERISADLPT